MKKLRLAAAALTAGLAMLVPAVADAAPMPLTFGIYPGGYAGGGSTTGKPDNPAEVRKALAQLQSGHRPFLLRDYLGCGSAFPDDEMQYLAPGRRLDVVLSYSGESMPEWQSCVDKTVHRYGPIADTISVTLEQNVVPQPNGDTALVQGVITGKKAADRDGFDRLQIGFDEVAYTQPFTQFWQHLAHLGGAEFSRSVGFVGVDLYPDAGLPGIPPVPDLAGFVHQTLHTVRTQEMPIAGLGRDVPIRVSENGWATHTAQRTPADQARALTTEILAVNHDRVTENVASYEMFALRDDVTGSPSPFDNFGVLTDDYTPKPMYRLYRGLISALS
ncbi:MULTISPECIES: hypothetical protein [unclassified Amycolatopsis]|uniref:hypothetical protein n=1 Tax=unclassified Amycolatopsis TaxID=2618356 RepID=UPI00106DFA62|nr:MULTISPECIES: hypothetical protein [unclassified Amycolatopsis]